VSAAAEEKKAEKGKQLLLPKQKTRRMSSNVEAGRRLSVIAPSQKDDNQILS